MKHTHKPLHNENCSVGMLKLSKQPLNKLQRKMHSNVFKILLFLGTVYLTLVLYADKLETWRVFDC